MSKERECARSLRAIVGKEPFQTYVAKVVSVEGAKCTVLRVFDEMEIKEVRLNCGTTENEGVVIVPKKDSHVLITSIDGLYWFVSQYSAIDKITVDTESEIIFNGGDNDGLVKIKELTKKLNIIEKDINNLKNALSGWIPVAQDGGAALKTALSTSAWIGNQLHITEQSEMEDTKITH